MSLLLAEGGKHAAESADLVTAQTNAHKLRNLLRMSDVAFAGLTPKMQGSDWWTILGVKKPSNLPQQTATGIDTLRRGFTR